MLTNWTLPIIITIGKASSSNVPKRSLPAWPWTESNQYILLVHASSIRHIPVLEGKLGISEYGISHRESGNTASDRPCRPDPHIMPMTGWCSLEGTFACRYRKASVTCWELALSINEGDARGRAIAEPTQICTLREYLRKSAIKVVKCQDSHAEIGYSYVPGCLGIAN